MNQPILDELEQAADEILSKSKEAETIEPEDVSEDAEETDDANGGEAEDEPDDGTEDSKDDDEPADSVKKSFEQEILGEDGVRTETMSALVEIFAKSLTDVIENVADSRETSENSSSTLAKSLLRRTLSSASRRRAWSRRTPRSQS